MNPNLEQFESRNITMTTPCNSNFPTPTSSILDTSSSTSEFRFDDCYLSNATPIIADLSTPNSSILHEISDLVLVTPTSSIMDENPDVNHAVEPENDQQSAKMKF